MLRYFCLLFYLIRSTPCPNAKHGEEWGDPTGCENGDACQYCHTRTEQQFHPEIYKSTKCHDMQTNSYCPRGSFCAFAHGDFEVARENGQFQVCFVVSILFIQGKRMFFSFYRMVEPTWLNFYRAHCQHPLVVVSTRTKAR